MRYAHSKGIKPRGGDEMDTDKIDSIQTKFNGALWLARDLHYSNQFLGSGKTEKEALNDMKQTIKEHKIKYHEELYY
jgi:hypothetical protein